MTDTDLHDEAEADRRLWSSKYALEHAADAAACCKGRDPRDVVDDALRVAEAGANEVWQLTLVRPDARDAYDHAADGVSALRAAGAELDALHAERHYDTAWGCFQQSLRALGW